MRKVIGWSLAAGTVAMAGSVAIINTLMPMMGEPILPSMYWASVIGSYSIGTPITFYCLRQNKILRSTLAETERMRAELSRANRMLEIRNRLDGMTGLLNRETFLSEVRDSLEAGQDAGVLIVDIDHFKMINDTWGHLTGDKAIMAIVETIVELVGDGGLVGRLGGEEFAVMLPNADVEQARRTAEKLRVAVEAIKFYPVDKIRHPLTVSIGGTALRDGAVVSDIIRLADRLLYKAKNDGRNRAHVSAAA